MTNQTNQTRVPSLEDLRRMPDAELLAYAESHDNEAAWDEFNERGADRQFSELQGDD